MERAARNVQFLLDQETDSPREQVGICLALLIRLAMRNGFDEAALMTAIHSAYLSNGMDSVEEIVLKHW